MYTMSRDASTWMYATIFVDGQWDAITGGRRATWSSSYWRLATLRRFTQVRSDTVPGATSFGPTRSSSRQRAAWRPNTEWGQLSPREGHKLTDDEGEDEQAEEHNTIAAEMLGAAADDPFPDTTKIGPPPTKAERNAGAPTQATMARSDPFPAMAVTQKETEVFTGPQAGDILADGDRLARRDLPRVRASRRCLEGDLDDDAPQDEEVRDLRR